MGEEPAYNAGNMEEDAGSIPELGRSPGKGNGIPCQYSCLESPMDRGAWYSPWGRKESDMTEQLSMQHAALRTLCFHC